VYCWHEEQNSSSFSNIVGMRSKTVLVLAIAVAFVIGIITTGTLVYASGEKNGTPFEQIWEAIHNQVPISIGMPSLISSIEITEFDCQLPSTDISPSVRGPVVLLSDGTVKVPSPTAGFTTPGLEFRSLPDDFVWHDIEVNDYKFSSAPKDCLFPGHPGFREETIAACAIAGNGDVYCVDGSSRDGTLLSDSTPWTLQGNALP